jgi:hypothetical protein
VGHSLYRASPTCRESTHSIEPFGTWSRHQNSKDFQESIDLDMLMVMHDASRRHAMMRDSKIKAPFVAK